MMKPLSSHHLEGRVCAVVVTFNRQQLLRECLVALQNQTRAVDEILVVDNASTDNTRAMLASEFPDLPVLALSQNGGGAGGFHAGMKQAMQDGYDWLWLMDDDGRPAPECLQNLLNHAPQNDILVPVQQDSDGRAYGFSIWRKRQNDVTAEVTNGQKFDGEVPIFHFVGPLISRSLVEKIGLPRAEFFIWFDDIEYALRAHKKGAARVKFVADAVFHHDFGGKARKVYFMGRPSIRRHQPPWKEYYGARNYLFALTRNRFRLPDLLHFLIAIQLRGIIGDLMYEPDRWKRIRLRVRGLGHGALGWMGKRVNP